MLATKTMRHMLDESVTGRWRGRRRGEHGGCGRRGESGSSVGGDGGVVDTVGHRHGPRHDPVDSSLSLPPKAWEFIS